MDPQEAGGWNSTEALAQPPATAPFNLGGQVRGRGPQEAVSSPPERGVSSRERGLPRAQLLCWVGKPAGGPEQGRVQATSRLGGFLCVQSWHRTFSSQSRDGKEAAGWGRVSWYLVGGGSQLFSQACAFCVSLKLQPREDGPGVQVPEVPCAHSLAPRAVASFGGSSWGSVPPTEPRRPAPLLGPV